MQASHSVKAHRGLFWRRSLALWTTLALLVAAAAIALLLVAGGSDPTQSAPAGPQPTQVSVTDRQVPRAGHPVAE